VNGGGAGATAGDEVDKIPTPPQKLKDMNVNFFWSKKNKSWYYFDKNGNKKKYGG
jgi:hypothetical protein